MELKFLQSLQCSEKQNKVTINLFAKHISQSSKKSKTVKLSLILNKWISGYLLAILINCLMILILLTTLGSEQTSVITQYISLLTS